MMRKGVAGGGKEVRMRVVSEREGEQGMSRGKAKDMNRVKEKKEEDRRWWW